METKIAIFRGKGIRRTIHNDEWWFSVVDVVEALTDSANSRDYWYKMKVREKDDAGIELSTICRQFKLVAPDGKSRETDCANTEGLFRIIQSIPSPKAEPFKRWLARVGYERVKEIENPELSMERMRAVYKQKGYPKEWIDKRIRGIAVRHDLTKEWDERGAAGEIEYAILTNDIMEGTFGLKVEDYKKLKSLKRENLRDHMDDLELILTMLGEATTTKLTRDRDTNGFPRLRKDAKDGGAIAGRTRKDIEQHSGKPVVTSKNFIGTTKKKLGLGK